MARADKMAPVRAHRRSPFRRRVLRLVIEASRANEYFRQTRPFERRDQGKITAKVEKLARLFERLSAIEVTVDLKQEQNPAVDIAVSAEHKHDFVAAEQSTSLMAALDGVIHKLEHQLRKYKEKVQDHHRTAGAAT